MTDPTPEAQELRDIERHFRAAWKQRQHDTVQVPAYGLAWNELKALIAAEIERAVREAEDRVIAVAHQSCECGRDHKATPVRSVQGGITSYCQFSRVQLQSHKEKEKE